MNMTSLAPNYALYSTGGKIEPAMHVINSLGLPRKDVKSLNSSASYFATTIPETKEAKFSNTSSNKPTFETLESLKYDTVYNSKIYRPSSVYSFSSSKNQQNSNCIDPLGYGILRSYSNTDGMTGRLVGSGWKSDSYIDPDENNNFQRDQRGRFTRCVDRTSEVDPSDRICQLAQPKRLPCEYQEDRSIYCSYKRMRPNCGNHTHFETTPRLDELAMPKIVKDDCMSRQSSCSCEMSCYCQVPEQRVIDWSRLATPKQRSLSNFRPLQHVKKSALKAEPTKRLCKLSVPKPVIDVTKFYLWLWGKKPDTKVKLAKVERLFITKCQMTDMRVMVRCDLDPSTGGGVDAKMAAVVHTIKYALSKGAKSVIIVSNVKKAPCCGIPCDTKETSLKPLTKRFEELLGTNVLFLGDCVGYEARALCRDPEPGTVFLLENLAFHPEETGYAINEKGEKVVCSKEKIDAFRQVFFDLCDTYVIETFREFVALTNSTTVYPNQERAYGFKVKSELDSYNRFVVKPRKPMVAIVGGPIKDTYVIIGNLMGIATDIVIGGETALAFLKVLKRNDLGTTHITPKMERKVLNLHSRAKDTKTALLLPSDVVVRRVGSGQYFTVLTRDDVDDDYDIVDIGPFTRKCYSQVIEKAATVLWWGNMGTLSDGTLVVADAFARAGQNGALTYVADDGSKVGVSTTDHGRNTHVTEDSVATTMLLKGKLPKGLAALNPPRKKIKKREPAAPPVSRKPIKFDLPGSEIASGEKIMCISDVNIEGKTVIIRVDFNVPMQGHKILNNYRIRMVVPTIKYALKWRARAVVVLGHFGFPEGKREEHLTMKYICDELASLLGHTVVFVPETVGKTAETAIASAHPGTGGLMWKTTYQEATPQAIAVFCEKITRLGDVFVNDAFASLNYDHSSVLHYYLPTRVCGFLVKNELKYMARILNNPQRRLLVILGGNSFKEKIPILKELLREADDIILVGSLGVGFLKMYLNISIGMSVFDPNFEQDIKAIIDLADYYSCRLFYPVDLIIASNKQGENWKHISISEPIPDNQMVIDIGDLTSSMYCRIIRTSKMVFWVGTAGIAESEPGSKATKKIMDTMIEVTKDPEKNVITVIGGRSTYEFIHRFDSSHENFTHQTTGSIAAFKLLTDRYLMAIDNFMPKQSKRPIRVLGVEQIDVVDKRVLVRADLDVPVSDGKVLEPFPLTNLATTVKYLLKRGARSVVLIGDRGNPEGKIDNELSLLPLKQTLENLIEQDIYLADEGVSESAEAASKSRKVVLVENVKFHPEEEGLKDGPRNVKIKVAYDAMDAFRATLTSLGDIFVNESLSTLHMTFSSVVGVGNIRKVAGPTLKKIILKFEEFTKNLERPLLLIMGGGQPLDDIPVLYKVLDLVDEVILCGSLALTVLKTETGTKLGKFRVSAPANNTKLVPRVIKKAKMNKIDIHLPVDFVADVDPSEPVGEANKEQPSEDRAESGQKEDRQTVYTALHGIPDDLLPVDIGPETISIFQDVISEAKTVIFQGVVTPYYMFEKCQTGSKAIIEAISKLTSNEHQTIAVGMQAVTCVSMLDAVESFSLCTIGRQVLFDMLRGKPIPGLKVLEEGPGKPLKKLSIEQMDLANQRVLIRLDLFVPTVEGVVLDTDKLEEAAPTILYALKQGAKCVILLGHRGNPNGYKNKYLSMEPLVVDLSQILERPVTLIQRPCSRKTRELLADPAPGSVFLMENLKYYPAEYGIDAEPFDRKAKRMSHAATPEVIESIHERLSAHTSVQFEKPDETEEEEEPEDYSVPSSETVSDGSGGINIDSIMFRRMTPKSVADYIADLAACGDVFINDDVADIAEQLISLEGFGLPQRGCGLLLAAYLSDMDDQEIYNLPGIASLSPAPTK